MWGSQDTAGPGGTTGQRRQEKVSALEWFFSHLFLFPRPQVGSSGQHVMKAEDRVNAAWHRVRTEDEARFWLRHSGTLWVSYTALHRPSRPPTGRSKKEFKYTWLSANISCTRRKDLILTFLSHLENSYKSPGQLMCGTP